MKNSGTLFECGKLGLHFSQSTSSHQTISVSGKNMHQNRGSLCSQIIIFPSRSDSIIEPGLANRKWLQKFLLRKLCFPFSQNFSSHMNVFAKEQKMKNNGAVAVHSLYYVYKSLW